MGEEVKNDDSMVSNEDSNILESSSEKIFVNKSPSYSIDDFFKLPMSLNEIYDMYPPDKRKLLAWKGDTLFNYYVSTHLMQRCIKEDGNEDIDLGKLADIRNKLVSNQFFSIFLQEATDFFLPAGAINTNLHTFGTYFEFFFAIAGDGQKGQALNLVREDIAKQYIEYMLVRHVIVQKNLKDVATMYLEQINIAIKDEVFDPESGDNEQMNPACSQHFQRILENLEADPWMMYSAHRPNRSAISPHTGSLKTFSWKSRRGNEYKDSFWLCCGFRESETFCNVINWQKMGMHSGELVQTNSGSRREGGGKRPRGASDDHLPRMSVPRWNCCGNIAPAEGCKYSNHNEVLTAK